MSLTIWQVAAGEPVRDYSSLFLDHDIMLIGPGTLGPVTSNLYPGRGIDSQIRSFARDPQPGDLVLLRLGHEVLAIGVIPSGDDSKYIWSSTFDDVLGWDLQHVRRVCWSPEVLSTHPEIRSVFHDRLQQPTFTRIHIPTIRDKVLALEHIVRERQLKSLPEVSPILSDEELGIELFSAGVANDVIDQLIVTFSKIRRLATWYEGKHSGNRPTENEVVTHILVPLLRSLGWSEQLLAVEWEKVDVAIFDRVPTKKKNCIAVCEAKGLGGSLGPAFEQAKKYIDKLSLHRCKVIVTAEGPRMMIYYKEFDNWSDRPKRYLNCLRPRLFHLLPKGVNSVEGIVSLLPGRLVIS